MPLIACPNCREKISDTYDACPFCHYQLKAVVVGPSNCPHCRGRLSGSPKTCPHCGEPIEARGSVAKKAGRVVSVQRVEPEPRQFHTKIRGVTHECPNTGVSRQSIIEQIVRPGMRLHTIKEDGNPYDENAVAVGLVLHLGYFKGSVAEELRRAISAGKEIKVLVKDVTGGMGKTRGVNLEVTIE